MSSMSPPLAERLRNPGWVLLVLRAFIAVVFLDAGISKFADRRYLDSSSFMSIHSQISAVRAASPVSGLLGPVVDHSYAFGIFTGLAEIAVGVGIALGLFTRVAAVGGMVLSLSLWFTISWGASPWFTSADLVYLFAFTPLLLAGAGDVLSLDSWLARARAQHPGRSEDTTRRAIIGLGAVALTGVLTGAGALFRKSSAPAQAAGPASADSSSADSSSADPSSADPSSADPSSASSGSSGAGTSSAAPSNAVLAATSAVAVGKAKQVKDPSDGSPAWVLQLTAGQFSAVSAVCPHQGCTVAFVSPSDGFACPCHGSRFDATGKLLNGPATRALTTIPVSVEGSNIVVS
jgi:thiosulfate dehydrogenase (quinone) large subunit